MSTLAERSSVLAPRGPVVLLRAAWPFVVGLAVALAIHGALGAVDEQYASNIVTNIAIAIVLAVSLTLVNGFTGQFSIGHAGFMAIGGYVSAAITYYGTAKLYGDKQPHGGVLSWGLPLGDLPDDWAVLTGGDALFVGAALVGGLAAAAAGYVVGLPSLRLRGDYLAIVTLGFGEIVRVLFQSTQDQVTSIDEIRARSAFDLSNNLGKAVGMASIPVYTTLFWSWLAVAVTVIVTYRLKTSSTGRAFLSIREDEVAAEAMGVRTTAYKVRAFVLSSFFAGVAGALLAHQTGTFNAGEFGFMRSFDVVIMIVLGGLGSISGAVLAAILLTLLPEALRGVDQYRMIVYAVMLILIMILRPQGLFGVHEVWELPWLRRLFGRTRPKVSVAEDA